uniref:DSBA-like thioredoxin domain-containing protein n=1 Tax=Strongyloides venezuelensis TaxID=75913 RepID=A0A0K0F6C6_STRVS
MRKLKINYFFDIIHPQSYIGYQLLKKSISILSNNFNTTFELFPVSCVDVWKSNNVTPFRNLTENQRNLLNNEIENTCRSHSLDLHNMNVNRQFTDRLNRNCLLYLTMIKREHANLYLKFIETFFRKTWKGEMEINRGYIFFKISLELGLPFSVVDDLVSRTEGQINKSEYKSFRSMLSDVECKNLPTISFQFIEDTEKIMLIDSVAKFVLLYNVIKKDPYSLEQVIRRYCKI